MTLSLLDMGLSVGEGGERGGFLHSGYK